MILNTVNTIDQSDQFKNGKIMEKLEQLTHQKATITSEYLKTTPMAELKTKITGIETLAKVIHEIRDSTNWVDLPDATTLGCEAKQRKASDSTKKGLNIMSFYGHWTIK